MRCATRRPRWKPKRSWPRPPKRSESVFGSSHTPPPTHTHTHRHTHTEAEMKQPIWRQRERGQDAVRRPPPQQPASSSASLSTSLGVSRRLSPSDSARRRRRRPPPPPPLRTASICSGATVVDDLVAHVVDVGVGLDGGKATTVAASFFFKGKTVGNFRLARHRWAVFFWGGAGVLF